MWNSVMNDDVLFYLRHTFKVMFLTLIICAEVSIYTCTSYKKGYYNCNPSQTSITFVLDGGVIFIVLIFYMFKCFGTKEYRINIPIKQYFNIPKYWNPL